MQRISIDDFTVNGWTTPHEAAARSRHYCELLEEGNILFFPHPPFEFSEADRAFLLNVKQSDASYHKNIAYRPKQDKVTGFDRDAADSARLLTVMRNYSQRVIGFATQFLQPYSDTWNLDYASFRPVQEQGRQISMNARNDLIHVDAFPTRPTNGDRILRIFTNINPTESRLWVTTDPFDVVAPPMAARAGLPRIAQRARNHRRPPSFVRAVVRRLGYRQIDRSPYDQFMLDLHSTMKSDRQFQENCPKYRWEFAPGSTWMCFLDMVPHAALKGQYAVEQTFFVARQSLLRPDKAPINVLEKLCGVALSH